MLVLHFMAYYDIGYFYFKLNLNITQLEHIVGRVMVPLNRDFPSATTLALWEGYGRCLQLGKVMGMLTLARC